MKRSFSICLFAMIMAVPAAGLAQEAGDEEKLRSTEMPEPAVQAKEPSGPNAGRLSFTGGVDFTTAYFFRGYLQENQDLIVQPYLNVYFKLVDEEETTLTGYVGTWNSFHGEKTGADDGTFGAWYESDLYAGVDWGFGDGFTLGAIYTLYAYPNGAFETIEEVGLKLSYDDTDNPPWACRSRSSRTSASTSRPMTRTGRKTRTSSSASRRRSTPSTKRATRPSHCRFR